MSDKSKFICQLEGVEFKKSKEGGKLTEPERMYIEGIATTEKTDIDGEIIKAEGINYNYLLNNGFINWNHNSIDPSNIIGEVKSCEVKNYKKEKGLYIKGMLYTGNVLAEKIYEMGCILEKSGSSRRLGLSIEGTNVMRNKSNNKIIDSCDVTGLAVTPAPKNFFTFLDIVKGMVDKNIEKEYDEQEIVYYNAEKGMLDKEKCIGYYLKGNKIIILGKDCDFKTIEISKGATIANSSELIPESLQQEVIDILKLNNKLDKSIIKKAEDILLTGIRNEKFKVVIN